MAVTSSEKKRCDNLACLCETPLAQPACSDYCDSPEARDPANIRCRCGHSACEVQVERQLHGGIGRESL
jgi:acetone carboxylase gamma subunit